MENTFTEQLISAASAYIKDNIQEKFGDLMTQKELAGNMMVGVKDTLTKAKQKRQDYYKWYGGGEDTQPWGGGKDVGNTGKSPDYVRVGQDGRLTYFDRSTSGSTKEPKEIAIGTVDHPDFHLLKG